MRVRVTLAGLGAVALLASCSHVPPPTQEEIHARDEWEKVVSPEARAEVYDQVSLHTGWSEKRKVLYELDRFQHIARAEDRKARSTQPSSTRRAKGEKGATKPAAAVVAAAEGAGIAQPATRFSTTHHATTRGATTLGATTRRHHSATQPNDSDD